MGIFQPYKNVYKNTTNNKLVFIILALFHHSGKIKIKGNDYVKRQYIGNLGKIENGIVVVTAYGVIDNITFPLTFLVYKQ